MCLAHIPTLVVIFLHLFNGKPVFLRYVPDIRIDDMHVGNFNNSLMRYRALVCWGRLTEQKMNIITKRPWSTLTLVSVSSNAVHREGHWTLGVSPNPEVVRSRLEWPNHSPRRQALLQ